MFLVSACLAGEPCRYDGSSCPNKNVQELVARGMAISACPELLGGLCVPREPCEIIDTNDEGRRVLSKSGRDYTEAFALGAERLLALCQKHGIKKAILQSNSPSCGCGLIYDGTFSDVLKEGNGITAQCLIGAGISVESETE